MPSTLPFRMAARVVCGSTFEYVTGVDPLRASSSAGVLVGTPQSPQALTASPPAWAGAAASEQRLGPGIGSTPVSTIPDDPASHDGMTSLGAATDSLTLPACLLFRGNSCSAGATKISPQRHLRVMPDPGIARSVPGDSGRRQMDSTGVASTR